ncbi:MAG TPA: FAD-binding oxidoreductase [Stellaceae bacterium]|nr:FAD-binding oxidoreductase [Stellaceae bacterium]
MARDGTAAWPAGPSERRSLVTMDGGVRVASAAVQRPDRHAHFRKHENALPAIPRGAGFSFAAASFGSGAESIEVTAFDRVLDFDTRTGQVEVEAGATLGALFEILAVRGYYLPVQPGHHRITVGGCIAANVHGKNPARDGTFVAQVESVRLFHPHHGCLELSRDKEPALFHATCGGMGLTGIIVAARLRTQRLPGASLRVAHRQVTTIAEGAGLLTEDAARSDLAYGWFDCARRGRAHGRGIVVTGQFVSTRETESTLKLPRSRFSPEARAWLPFSLLNPASIRLVNAAYFWSLRRSSNTIVTLADGLYPTRANELYLSLFGRRGLHECQALVPHANLAEFAARLRDHATRAGACITLTVAKPFNGTSDLIRFDGSGISLAIEMPRSAAADRLLPEVDRLVVDLGGRPNIIKDSRLPRSIFEATYPDCDRFRTILRRWDPQRLFRSELSERLGL